MDALDATILRNLERSPTHAKRLRATILSQLRGIGRDGLFDKVKP